VQTASPRPFKREAASHGKKYVIGAAGISTPCISEHTKVVALKSTTFRTPKTLLLAQYMTTRIRIDFQLNLSLIEF
jgi:hypothetical protein